MLATMGKAAGALVLALGLSAGIAAAQGASAQDQNKDQTEPKETWMGGGTTRDSNAGTRHTDKQNNAVESRDQARREGRSTADDDAAGSSGSASTPSDSGQGRSGATPKSR